MDTRHHAYRTPAHAGPGHEAALRWLARQLRWEHLLADLRGPDDDDRVAS
jgi:hypothetical protein